MTDIIPVTSGSFANDVLAAERPVLVDFWAQWCGPCRSVAPVLERLAGERDDLTVAKVDVDAEPDLAQRHGVRSIPTLVLFDQGRILATRLGATDLTAINHWLDEALAVERVQ